MLKAIKEVGKILLKVSLFCTCVVLFNQFIAQRVVVVGESMRPAYEDKENLIMERISYRFTDPERFDVVVVDTEGPFGIIIKRVIGLPGETVLIEEDGDILINGEVLEENYGAETIREDKRGLAATEIKLDEGEFFVLGDNRNNSGDSRTSGIGTIEKDQFLGKILFKIPFAKGLE